MDLKEKAAEAAELEKKVMDKRTELARLTESIQKTEEEEMREDLQKIEELLNMSEEERYRELEMVLADKRRELAELKKEVEKKEEEIFSISFCLGMAGGKTT